MNWLLGTKDGDMKNTSIFLLLSSYPYFIPFRLYLANPNGFDATKVRLIDQTLLSIFYILFFVLVFSSGVDKKRTSH